MDTNYAENDYQISIEENSYGSITVIDSDDHPTVDGTARKVTGIPWNAGMVEIKPKTLTTSNRRTALVKVNDDFLSKEEGTISTSVDVVGIVQTNGIEVDVRMGTKIVGNTI